MLFVGGLTLIILLAQTSYSSPERESIPEMRVPVADEVAAETRIPKSRPANPPTEATRHRLANGLDVTLYSSDLLASRLVWRSDGPVIPLDDGRYLSVITDIDDPSISNKGDRTFHPFSEEMIIEVLESISHPNLDVNVQIYILPYPRRNLLVSSTSGRAVFLSPHVLDIHPAVLAYIVAHEIGHVFHHAYLPDDSPLWGRYRQIRGITDTWKYSATRTHAYRPAEIFAEDFRVLFGSVEAAFGGRVENPELPSPLVVAGLKEFFAGLGGTPLASAPKVRATSYPNPFNPDTEIRINIPNEILSARKNVTVRIYDVRGALVTEIYSDVPNGEDLFVHWDGRDQRGNSVASANYFALIEAGRTRTTLKLVLLK
jgi:hypothetical protein